MQFDKNKLPTDIGLLPSKGLVYPPSHPFHNLTYVPIRTMLVEDEEILLNAAFIKYNMTTIELLKSCICLPNVELLTNDNILAGDVASLLYSIRINSYGSIYDSKIKCISCDTETDININLARFPVNTLDLTPIKKWSNIFKYTFKKNKTKSNPASMVDIEFGFMYYSQMLALQRMTKATDDMSEEFMHDHNSDELSLIQSVKTNTVVTTTLDNLIVSVNDDSNRNFIHKFINSMRLMDSMNFRNYVKQYEPTIYTDFDFICSNEECKFGCKIPMPTDYELFGIRPENKTEVLLEPHFILTYYAGFSYESYKKYPVAYKKYFIDRINEEIAKAQKEQSDIPTKAPHHNSDDVRSLLGKTKPQTSSAKLQRFT